MVSCQGAHSLPADLFTFVLCRRSPQIQVEFGVYSHTVVFVSIFSLYPRPPPPPHPPPPHLPLRRLANAGIWDLVAPCLPASRPSPPPSLIHTPPTPTPTYPKGQEQRHQGKARASPISPDGRRPWAGTALSDKLSGSEEDQENTQDSRAPRGSALNRGPREGKSENPVLGPSRAERTAGVRSGPWRRRAR